MLGRANWASTGISCNFITALHPRGEPRKSRAEILHREIRTITSCISISKNRNVRRKMRNLRSTVQLAMTAEYIVRKLPLARILEVLSWPGFSFKWVFRKFPRPGSHGLSLWKFEHFLRRSSLTSFFDGDGTEVQIKTADANWGFPCWKAWGSQFEVQFSSSREEL